MSIPKMRRLEKRLPKFIAAGFGTFEKRRKAMATLLPLQAEYLKAVAAADKYKVNEKIIRKQLAKITNIINTLSSLPQDIIEE